MNYLLLITIPMTAGFVLDALLGDPLSKHHPVVLIGKLISLCERHLRSGGKRDFAGGAVTAITVSVAAAGIPGILLFFTTKYLGTAACCILSSLLCWQMLAARGLATESGKVRNALENGSIDGARHTVSMIVGRDTDELDESGIIRAAVETVAENTTDGVTAPLFFMALLGVPGLFLYKAVNTMDSMIGYRNEKYLLFGRIAARMDDVLNFLPARITAVLMIVAAVLLPGMDGRNAAAVFWRDRRKSSSPNAGCTESVTAGALRISLLGPACYFGKRVEKPFLGNPDREPEPEDIRRAGRLMYLTSALMLIVLSIPAITLWLMNV